MAATPYQVAQTQSALLDSLLGEQQGTSMARLETKTQKSRMVEEFDKELIEAQKKTEKELNKRRKKKWWEKAVPVLSLFAGPIGAAVMSGMTSMYGASKGESHARKQIQKARIASKMDPRWKKNFLSKPMREQEEYKRKSFDKMAKDIDISGMDILTTGLTSGLQAYGMGKITQGMGEAWKGAGVAPPGDASAVFNPDVMAESAFQGDINVGDIIGNIASVPAGIAPRIGTGKLKEFAKLLKENLSKGGASDLSEIFENNEALLQNLLFALQWGQQLEEEG